FSVRTFCLALAWLSGMSGTDFSGTPPGGRPRPFALGAKGTEGRGPVRGCRGDRHVPRFKLAAAAIDPAGFKASADTFCHRGAIRLPREVPANCSKMNAGMDTVAGN